MSHLETGVRAVVAQIGTIEFLVFSRQKQERTRKQNACNVPVAYR
jgi:hypothetical protein